jgi:tricorn protease-like protein
MCLLAAVFAVAGAAVVFIGWGATTSAAVPAPPSRLLVYATPPGVGDGACRPECRPDRAWVWRAAVDGRKRARLTHGLAPTVSPDGRWVAFVRERRDGTQTEIDLIGSSGGSVRRLMHLEAQKPVYKLSWASDSGRLVAEFVGRLVTAANLGQISFSPDGSQIAYVKTAKAPRGYFSDVYVTSVSGGAARRITSEGDADGLA